MSKIPFARPDIGDREIAAVTKVLRSGWLTTGPEAKAFERELAAYVGVARAVAVNSGTAALHLALEAIGVTTDDEVIVPTWTFTASAEVARYLGARPVFVDVHRGDLNIEAAAVERAITKRTKAIVGVDIGGQPCDWHLLRELARPRDIVLVDDAAHALPASLHGRRIGTWADITAFSFYATKTLTTGEGGMLVTDNGKWADRAEVMALHGISRDAWKRYTAEGTWRYEVIAPGFKYNLTDIAAALGRVQLSRVEEMAERRTAIAARYSAAFAEIPELEPPVVAADRVSAWQLYVLRLNLDRLAKGRDAFITELGDRGVSASVHFIPLHLHPYWRDTYALRPEQFPVASAEFERVVSLPIYSTLSEAEVERVIEAVGETLNELRR
ncbi:MAG: DegT/DnrJ/EryC1/StrS aminotransferase family protein [Chloroflexi bacterium]|nr:MAG: DegT/DnrJ/EryC1/StrS aminotransferase family protein [Chloroflexota bacterium]